MTNEEMDAVIQEWCRKMDETSDKPCEDCLIKDICRRVEGDFECNPDACKEAYDILAEQKLDFVNHPAHYESGKYECIDVMTEALGEEATKGFCLCNAFKYIYRCKRKHDAPIEDVQKALWYLKKFLELEGVYHDKELILNAETE